jgi:TetR/AcrR family transcriptional regulator, tetracycline repressor protein
MATARRDGVTTTGATAPAAAPRRGRPPRATREQIVDAAVALLRDAPDEPLTMARVANAVGLTPMALYRHFKDRNELMDDVVGQILMERNAAIPREGPWQDQLRAWILGGLDHLVPCSQVVQVVFAGGSSRWVHDAATLVRILDQAGFADDELAEMQVWIALSVGGYVMAESSRRQAPNSPEVYAALARLEPEDAARMATLIPQIDRAFDQMHERFADRLIQTVEAAAPS